MTILRRLVAIRWILFIGIALIGTPLMGADLYWHPVLPSIDGTLASNWTTDVTGTVRPARIAAGDTLRFDGVGATSDADCTFGGNLTVLGIVSTTANPYTGTITDNGYTLTCSECSLATGTLAFSGTLVLTDPSNATTSALTFRLPTGAQAAGVVVQLNYPAGGNGNGDVLSFGSDMRAKTFAVTISATTTGHIAWNAHDLTLTGTGGTNGLIGAGTLVHDAPLGSLHMAGAGSTISWSPGSIPALAVDADTTLALASAGDATVDGAATIAVADGATLTLGSNLGILTVPVGGKITTAGGGGIATTAAVILRMASNVPFVRSGSGNFTVGAVINLPGNATFTNDATAGTLTIAGGFTGGGGDLLFDGSGATRVTGNDARSRASLTFAGGSRVTWMGTATVASNAQATGTGAVIRGGGSLPVFALATGATATIAPGEGDVATGTLGQLTLVDGDLSGGNGATISVRARDAAADHLAVTGTLTTAGTSIVVNLTERTIAGRIDGIVTYGALAGAGFSGLSLTTVGLASGWTATLDDDAANGEVDLVLTSPPPVISSPLLPISTGFSTRYTAICPGSAANLARVKSLVAGRAANEVRTFAWDAVTQAYVELPAEPTGGLQPWHALFIATRIPLDLGFTGNDTAPMTLQPLEPGWNFVGLPPIDDGGSLHSHTPIADLQGAYNEGGAYLGAPIATLIGSTTWLWDGSQYQERTSMQYWHGYWLLVEDLGTAGGSVRLVRPAGVIYGTSSVVATAMASSTQSQSPPAPPADGAPASPAGGCGSGSAFAMILVGLALAFGRSRGRFD